MVRIIQPAALINGIEIREDTHPELEGSTRRLFEGRMNEALFEVDVEEEGCFVQRRGSGWCWVFAEKRDDPRWRLSRIFYCNLPWLQLLGSARRSTTVRKARDSPRPTASREMNPGRDMVLLRSNAALAAKGPKPSCRATSPPARCVPLEDGRVLDGDGLRPATCRTVEMLNLGNDGFKTKWVGETGAAVGCAGENVKRGTSAARRDRRKGFAEDVRGSETTGTPAASQPMSNRVETVVQAQQEAMSLRRESRWGPGDDGEVDDEASAGKARAGRVIGAVYRDPFVLGFRRETR
ncbi:hypothetical protein C8R46DRAFT_1194184 [Mycena filopes]|nr:hypothetical protein C8R46DRAFT_1194184 [Mycena filopes]